MLDAARPFQCMTLWLGGAVFFVFATIAVADTPLNEPIPEDTVVEIECSWNQKGSGVNPPTVGTYYYSVYLPTGYYEKANAKRKYPCLLITSQRGRIRPYQRWLKANGWIGVSLKETMVTQRLDDPPDYRPRKAKGNFLAAMTDAARRFRLNRGVGIMETRGLGSYLPPILLPLANGYFRGVFMVGDASEMSALSRGKIFIAAIGSVSGVKALKPSELQKYPRGYADWWLWPAESRGLPNEYATLGLDWLADRLMAAPGIRRDPLMVGQYLLKCKSRADLSENVLEKYLLLQQMQRTLKANTKALNAPGVEDCIKSADEQFNVLKKDSWLNKEIKAWAAYQEFYRNVVLHMEKMENLDNVQTLARSADSSSTAQKRERLREELLKYCLAFVKKYADTQASLKVLKMGKAFEAKKPAGQWDLKWPALTLEQLQAQSKPPATQPVK